MRMPKLMRIDNFSDWSGIGRTRVYGLIGVGTLRAIKIGRRTLIDVEAANEWLNNQPVANIRMGGRTA